MRCHVDPDELSPSQLDNDQNVEQVKADRRDHEQVHGCDVRRMVAQKRAPTLPGWVALPDHVLGDGRLSHRKAELEQLSMEIGMPQPERFETLVLGSGNGGMFLAWHMTRSGRTYCRGGAPLDWRLLSQHQLPPSSKNEIWSAKVADLVHHGTSFGAMTGSVGIDMAKVRQRKRDMVEGEIATTLQQYKASGVELIMGVGNFVAPENPRGAFE